MTRIKADLVPEGKSALLVAGEDDSMSAGSRIHDTRKKFRVPVAAIAQAAGVSKQAVYEWESGDTKSLKGDNLLAVARVLGVDANWLSTGRGPMVGDSRGGVTEIAGDAAEVARAYMKLSPALKGSVRTMIFTMASAHTVAKWLMIEPPKGDGYEAWERKIQAAYEAEIKQLKLDFGNR